MLRENILKTNITFPSSNGTDTIHAWFYQDSGLKTEPKAILQLSHGMCEYIARYDDFASYMAQKGFIVCGNDHLGHGETSGTNGVDGYFAKQDGDKCVLKDLLQMNTLAKQKYPGLKLFLLGHSMGSFFARQYATQYPDTIDGLIISGTGGPNPMAGFAIWLTKIIGKRKGLEYRSAFINNLAFGSYCKKIKNSTSQYDWVTSDAEILKAYKADAKCTFIFTVGAFKDMLTVNKMVNCQAWADKLNKDKPIFMFSGAMDPVGEYGKGVKKVFGFLQNAGIKDLKLKLYDDGLHEMLNAPDRQQVYDDVANWLNEHL